MLFVNTLKNAGKRLFTDEYAIEQILIGVVTIVIARAILKQPARAIFFASENTPFNRESKLKEWLL